MCAAPRNTVKAADDFLLLHHFGHVKSGTKCGRAHRWQSRLNGVPHGRCEPVRGLNHHVNCHASPCGLGRGVLPVQFFNRRNDTIPCDLPDIFTTVQHTVHGRGSQTGLKGDFFDGEFSLHSQF